jgi:CDP-glucose 4,6-dehydratase
MEGMERLAFWEGRRVLVTGATGVVGLNLVNTLAQAGSEITTLVRDWVPRTRHLGAWLTKSGTVGIVRGELEDYSLLERTIAEYETEYIFHLGAQTIVPVGNRSPVTTFRANIAGTWNLLEACRVLGMYDTTLRAICVASSDKAYGSSQVLPYTEEMPLSGEHPYDVSKSCTDLIAQSYGKTYDLPIGIARMGNIYGPGDLNFNRIVPGTIRSVLEGRTPSIRSDGTPVREYFYVGDAVDAYLTLAEQAERQSLHGEAFNFSSGEKLPVRDVVREIIRLMNSSVEPEIQNISRHEIQNQYLSIEKARQVLDWQPRVSLEDGMRRTIAWYREVLQ